MELADFKDSLKRLDQEIGKPIIVPSGIRYISDWKEYDEKYLLDQPHILDKKIPGCGFTEYCIRNSRNIILCSPRKILLQNKFDQHNNDVFYAANELDISLNVDKDYNLIGATNKIASKPKQPSTPSDEEKEILKQKSEEQYRKLYFELLEYKSRMNLQSRPLKILVTYDSYGIIKSILGEGKSGLAGFGIFDQFYTIVDEFQSIFTDAVFKSSTEIKFIEDLRGVQKVCYVSATPMIGTYLSMIPEFKDLPYYYLDWASDQPERIEKPKLKIHTIKSIVNTVRTIVNKYRSSKTEMRVVNNEVIYSREAVIYVNSVNNICNIISRIGLCPEEVNILCADTVENQSRLKKKLGNDFVIGKVPLLNEPRKMFTFCTRTVYLGADFYSNNAKTYIISDANVDCMAVDISLDLPQILGRQRLTENPWKNEADFYYIPQSLDRKQTEEEFRAVIEAKLRQTQKRQENYETACHKDTAARDIEYIALSKNYKEDYLSVKKVYDLELGDYRLIPTKNRLVYIADLRAYDVQQKDYADRFSVFSRIDKTFDLNNVSEHVKDFFSVYDTLTNFTDRAKFLCESDSLFTQEELDQILCQVDPLLGDCYRNLGRSVIMGYSYNITDLRRVLEKSIFNKEVLDEEIYKTFKVGDNLSNTYIKSTLNLLYERVGRGIKAKATDLEQYFDLRYGKFKNSQGKWENGYRILKIKEKKE